MTRRREVARQTSVPVLQSVIGGPRLGTWILQDVDMIRITCPRPCQNECRAVKQRRSRHQQQKASHMRWTSRNSTTAQPCSVTIEKRESVCKAVAKLLGVQWHRTTPPHVHTTRSHVRLCSHGLQRNSANFQQNPVHLTGQLIFPCWLHLQLVGKGFRSLQLTKMSRTRHQYKVLGVANRTSRGSAQHMAHWCH